MKNRRKNEAAWWLTLAFACLAAGAVWVAHKPAPVSADRVLYVGANRDYKRISDVADRVRPGDTVLIDPGVYNEWVRWRKGDLGGPPITIRGAGVGKTIVDGSGLSLPGNSTAPRALFQVEGDNYVIENLEFRNATNQQNAAGIRVVYSKKAVIRHVRVTRCDMGIMSSNNSELVVEHSEIAHNGTPFYNGYAHNLYLDSEFASVRYCYIHDSASGENFKSRSRYTEVLYNYIADAHDSFDGGKPTKEIGFPHGEHTQEPNSHAVMIGNIIVKRGDGWGFIEFGPEGNAPARNGTLFMVHNTVIREGDGKLWILHLTHPDQRAVLHNNIFVGTEEFSRGKGAGNVTGSNNWFPTGTKIPAGIVSSTFGDDPGFVDRERRDYRLRGDSRCLDAGVAIVQIPSPTGEMVAAAVTQEYVAHLEQGSRPVVAAPDLGAFEASQEERQNTSGLTVSGRLTSTNGVPLVRRSVTLRGAPAKSVVSDGDGRFFFRDVLPGREYHVTPWPDYLPFQPAAREFVPLDRNQTVDFQVGDVFRISGKVRGTDGRPLVEMPVILLGNRPSWTYCDANGEFLLAGVPSGESYLLKPVISNFEFTPAEVQITGLNSDRTVDFVGAGRFLIAGHIQDANGVPIPDVVVTITGGPEVKTGVTNVRGNFDIRWFPERHNYVATPTHGKYRFEPPNIEVKGLDRNVRDLAFTGHGEGRRFVDRPVRR